VSRWCKDSEEDFTALFPFQEGRGVFADMVNNKVPRLGGLAKVIRTENKRAVLLISGVPLLENSGDATTVSRVFSGVYEARQEGSRWSLVERVRLETLAQIRGHRLKVFVRPAEGINVEDKLTVVVKGHYGFVARLNWRARLRHVRVASACAQYAFAGGLLWIDVPRGETEITVTYSIEVEEGPNATNSGCFLRKAGHLRNQYFWHLFFDFGSAGDQADFEIRVQIPKSYKLTTGLQQSECIKGSNRIIVGRTSRRTFALTLNYDKDWKVISKQVRNVCLHFFVTPESRRYVMDVVREFRSVYSLISGRFGVPSLGRLGLVEARSMPGSNWLFTSNHVVVAAGWPRVVSSDEDFPRAFLGHEIAHFWTNGSGSAVHFLTEGWATYVESLIIASEFGNQAAQRFWKKEAENYFEEYEGKVSILEDYNNSGISYSKGAWVFRMLELAVGTRIFQKAMIQFSRLSLEHAATWDVLVDCFERQGLWDFDVRAFIAPWLKEKTAPHLTAKLKGCQLIVRQRQPFFTLPVTVEAITGKGPERRTVWIRKKRAIVTFPRRVHSWMLDPDGLLLLRK
jgi:hypothetical protein